MKFRCKNCGCTELTVVHYWDILTPTSREAWKRWGPLDDDHRPQFEEEELIEELTEENDDIEGREVDEESEEFYVECADCEREIPFGWSHPDRGGRIWPVECDDFIPGKSWMEPRYLEGSEQ